MNSTEPVGLPSLNQVEDVRLLPKGTSAYEAAIRVILHREKFDDENIQRLPGGSVPVFSVGRDMILKLFPPPCVQNGRNEGVVLNVISHRTTLKTPDLISQGNIADWHYVLMSRVPGLLLAEKWRDLSEVQIVRLCEGLGAALRELHSVPPPPALGYMSWPDFLRHRLSGAKAQQEKHGLSGPMLEQIDRWLTTHTAILETTRCVINHTEIMREHIFVGADGVTVTGFIDFEPSMLAPPEYDFVAVGLFLCEGRPARWHAFVRGYGHEWRHRESLTTTLMAYALIHRYSNLPWFQKLGPETVRGVSDLSDLAARWWPPS